MGVFNFMETSFVISLGITFVLILLLIYHFKQRLTATETKQDTMFEIINNLAQELNNLRGHISMLSRPSTPYPFSHMNNEVQFTHENPQQDDEPDEGSEEYSNDEDEDEDDERIIVSDDEDDDDDDISVEELSDNEDEKDELVIEDISESKMEEESKSQQTPNFSKMNLGSLKAYIVEKGLVEDASKMKKAQILTLIQEQQPAI
jgi:hypothetical protein